MKNKLGNQHLLPQQIVSDAIKELHEKSKHSSDGTWLESLTQQVAPHIKDWDVSHCWSWKDWPQRNELAPDVGSRDIGIDLVAQRGSDGKLIAIQCKSRRLDEEGKGSSIGLEEIGKFVTASKSEMWAERWLITNGNVSIASGARSALSMDRDNTILEKNLASDLLLQSEAFVIEEECPHCSFDPSKSGVRRTKSCMQREVVEKSVRILCQNKEFDSGGIPKGQARGRIILPCGTGKTRISLQIIERLTSAGQLSIVLCPSIALVAQIRREYLQHARHSIRALAVCSDKTAGYNPKKRGES